MNEKLSPEQLSSINRFLLQRDHLVIHGLAGTGKSYQINELVSKMIEHSGLASMRVCALTFDRKLRDKYRREYLWSNEMNSLTVHSLCFRVLKELNQLPEIFRKVEGDDVDTFEDATSKDFDTLIALFLELPDEELMRVKTYKEYFKSIKIIICDEVQDFREDYLQVVKKLKGLGENPQMVLAGDMHQKIYGFQEKATGKKLTEVLSQPEMLFGGDRYSTLILNENHRVENDYQCPFLNGYLRKVFQTDERLLYRVPEGTLVGDITDVPFILYVSTREDEFAFVENEVGRIASEGSTVTILGRSNKEIERYKPFGTEDGLVQVSTIHKKKGDSSDYIFLVGFDYDSVADPEIMTLVYTAISRAKRRLFITSSHPLADLDAIFEAGTYELVDTRVKLVKSYLIRRKIKENKKFTQEKLKGNHIDSVVLKIKDENCPFAPYIKKEGTKQKRFSSSKRIVTEDGVAYSVDLNHRWKSFYFNFKDLNVLKKNSFSDKQIVQYCINEVYGFFDHRVRLEDLYHHSLDLCKFLLFPDSEELERVYRDVLLPLILGSKHHSLKDQRGNGYTSESDFDGKGFSFLRDTLYINHHQDRGNGLTTVVYHPGYKENENRIHIPNLLKIEMRARGRVLSMGTSLLGESPTAGNLLELAERGRMKDVFEDWFGSYTGDSSATSEYEIENLERISEGSVWKGGECSPVLDVV